MTTQSDRVRGLIGSLGMKAPCVAATTANITLSAPQTIDGISVVAEDRVLVKDQTTASENGIYICQATTWIRAPDFDGERDTLKGTRVAIARGGTVNGGSVWSLNTADATIDTTSLSFVADQYLSQGTNTLLGTKAGDAITTGTHNTLLGYYAGDVLTTANYNVMVGSGAGGALTTASNNVLIGYNAGVLLTTVGETVAIGYLALAANTTGPYNTAVGTQALTANTTGDNNTALGYQALLANTTGADNIAIGSWALLSNTTGEINVAVGTDALRLNVTGSRNTAVGDEALEFATVSDNTAVGRRALYNLTTGLYNTAVGAESGGNGGTATGNNNTLMGYRAGYAVTSAADNVLIGYQAGVAITTAIQNTIIGSGSGLALTSTSYVTAVGYGNLLGATADVLTAVTGCVIFGNDNAAGLLTDIEGVIIGSSNIPTVTSHSAGARPVLIGHRIGGSIVGSWSPPSVAIGQDVILSTTTAGLSYLRDILIGELCGQYYQGHTANGENIAIGYKALLSANSGTRTSYENVVIASTGLSGATIAGRNVVIGYQAGVNGTTALDNVMVGHLAGNRITTGYRNVFIGNSAASNATATAYENVGVGYTALQRLTTGFNNTVIGPLSGSAITTGATNILIGTSVGTTLTTGTNNILIGNAINTTAVGSTYEVAIGDLFTGSMLSGDRQTVLNGALKLRRTAAAITGNGGDETVIGCTAANITITLTSAMIARAGRTWIIKDESGGAAGGTPITVATEGAETIDGAATATIAVAYGALRIYSNGTNLFTF